MSKAKTLRILWIAALILGAIGILGHFNLVIIRYVSDYNFELLLIGFVILVVMRLMKR